jgi:hypothetical protein
MFLCVPDSFTITSAALLLRFSLQDVCLNRQTELNYKLFSEFYKTALAYVVVGKNKVPIYSDHHYHVSSCHLIRFNPQ